MPAVVVAVMVAAAYSNCRRRLWTAAADDDYGSGQRAVHSWQKWQMEKYDKHENIQFLGICVSDKKNRMNEKLRCDILDIGNRIIVLLECLSKKKSDVWTLIRHL